MGERPTIMTLGQRAGVGQGGAYVRSRSGVTPPPRTDIGISLARSLSSEPYDLGGLSRFVSATSTAIGKAG